MRLGSTTSAPNRMLLPAVRLSEPTEAESDGIHRFLSFPFGRWKHPRYGIVELTEEMADEMVRNFREGVTGQDVFTDYAHESHGPASGRLEEVTKTRTGVQYGVKWTPRARQLIDDGEWNYFSPEIHLEWEHPETGVKHKNVSWGGGLTNRPALKRTNGQPQPRVALDNTDTGDADAWVLDDGTAEPEETDMNLQEWWNSFRQKNNLPDDADPNAVLADIQLTDAGGGTGNPPVTPPAGTDPNVAALVQQMSELSNNFRTFQAESNARLQAAEAAANDARQRLVDQQALSLDDRINAAIDAAFEQGRLFPTEVSEGTPADGDKPAVPGGRVVLQEMGKADFARFSAYLASRPVIPGVNVRRGHGHGGGEPNNAPGGTMMRRFSELAQKGVRAEDAYTLAAQESQGERLTALGIPEQYQ